MLAATYGAPVCAGGYPQSLILRVRSPEVDIGSSRGSPADAAMDRYAGGDDTAFSDLYDLLAPRLYGYFLRQTRDADLADDLTQQTLLKIHRARGQFLRGAAVEIVASGVRPSEIAVLVRTHALAGPVGEALAAAGMPFRHWAAQGLFQRPEIRDLVAYLRLLRDPSDLLALARLLVRPPLYADLAAVLRAPAFRLYAGSRIAAGIGQSMLQAIIAWQVYAISGSAR